MSMAMRVPLSLEWVLTRRRRAQKLHSGASTLHSEPIVSSHFPESTLNGPDARPRYVQSGEEIGG